MTPFQYVRAETLPQAQAYLAQEPDAMLLAGGMTLIPTLKQRLVQPSHLIDISRLPELGGISRSGSTLRVGAGVRHASVAGDEGVRQCLPALAALAGQIADPMVRNRGTMGGSVANNDPSADYPAAVLGLGGFVHTGARSIDSDHYFMGLFATALEPREVITAIEFRLPKAASYAKFAHPASVAAMAGVWISVFEQEVRVAVTGAGPGVFRWAEAEAALDAELHERSLDGLRVDPAELMGDMHGSAEYKAQLVHTMAVQALRELADA